MRKGSEAVKYDVGEYQFSLQLIRDARQDIDYLPEDMRQTVLDISQKNC